MHFDYKGFLHIHSDFSHDGTTDIKDIIKSAQKSGADFIIITDHFNIKAKDEGYEGYHDDLLVIVGEEISPAYNHYLAVGINNAIFAEKDADPQTYIDEVKNQNAAGMIAHPDHTGTQLFGIRSYEWKDWSVSGFDAMSIWDLMTDWQEKLTSYFKAFLAILFPAFILSGPKKETLERWDKINIENKEGKLVAGYGEIDNHNTDKKVFGATFKIFPFSFAFRTVSTHILLKENLSKDYEAAKRQIIDAIKNSSIYIAQEKWNDAKGFEFYISDSLRTAYSGETFKKGQNPVLHVKIPEKALIKIILNGKEIHSGVSDNIEKEIEETGIYRIEIFQIKFFSFKPWIFSNHIRVI